MNYKKFISFNAVGGVSWVLLASVLGYYFGNIPVVKNNFSLVMIAIVLISIMPAVIEYLRNKRSNEEVLN